MDMVKILSPSVSALNLKIRILGDRFADSGRGSCLQKIRDTDCGAGHTGDAIGGFVRMDSRQLARDVKSGLVGLTRKQLGFV